MSTGQTAPQGPTIPRNEATAVTDAQGRITMDPTNPSIRARRGGLDRARATVATDRVETKPPPLDSTGGGRRLTLAARRQEKGPDHDRPIAIARNSTPATILGMRTPRGTTADSAAAPTPTRTIAGTAALGAAAVAAAPALSWTTLRPGPGQTGRHRDQTRAAAGRGGMRSEHRVRGVG